MIKLTYRGKDYSQNKKAAKKQLVELTYRRNVYSNRQLKASESIHEKELTYRGISYQN